MASPVAYETRALSSFCRHFPKILVREKLATSTSLLSDLAVTAYASAHNSFPSMAATISGIFGLYGDVPQPFPF
jgi:hypothetical protein